MSWNMPPPGYGPPVCNCGPPPRPGEARHCHCMPSAYPPPPGPTYVPGATTYPSAPPSCTLVPAPQNPTCTLVPAPQQRPCGHTGIMYGCGHCDAVRHNRF